MLDQVMCSRNRRNPDVVSNSYTPEDAVNSQRLLNPEGQNLLVLFPPWHNGGQVFDLLATRSARLGWAVLHHNFADEILQTDTEKVLESFRQIRDQVSNRVNDIAPRYKRIHLFGASLGNVSMALTATKLEAFDSAQFVVAGSDLATCTWDGLRTQGIRRELERVGMTRERLIECWREIAPVTNATAFTDKPTRSLISVRDDVIHTESQIELVDTLASMGANSKTSTTKLGHYAAVAQFCVYGVVAGS